jgi:hypothetical protein
VTKQSLQRRFALKKQAREEEACRALALDPVIESVFGWIVLYVVRRGLQGSRNGRYRAGNLEK